MTRPESGLATFDAERNHVTVFAAYMRVAGSHQADGGIRRFSDFRKEVDATGLMRDRLPGIPDDVTHAKIAAYFAGLDVFKNHLRVSDTNKMRTTFVGTRWDLVEQDDLLAELHRGEAHPPLIVAAPTAQRGQNIPVLLLMPGFRKPFTRGGNKPEL